MKKLESMALVSLASFITGLGLPILLRMTQSEEVRVTCEEWKETGKQVRKVDKSDGVYNGFRVMSNGSVVEAVMENGVLIETYKMTCEKKTPIHLADTNEVKK